MSTSSFGAYKRVFMLGIDGMGSFNSQTETPVMDKLFANGATTPLALASRPTISGQCWTSMLTGATPGVHGLSNSDMHPIEGLPTIFGLVREAYPDAETACFSDWAPIANQIVSPVGGASHLDTGHDDDLVVRILDYLNDHDPKLLFIQFDSVDGAGHGCGYGFPGHLERITHVDGLLGQLVAKYDEKGWSEDTLFIVTADHGGTPERGHGGWSRAEREVFLGVAGKTVKKGTIGEVCMRDFPSIVLYALGVKAPAFNPLGYAAQMPVGIFEEAGVQNRVKVIKSGSELGTKPEPQKNSPQWIGNYIPEENIRFRMNFEKDTSDVSGHCQVNLEKGFVKLYTTGVMGQCGEFGKGTLSVKGCQVGPVFTICTWQNTPANCKGWIDILSTRDNVHRSMTFATLDCGIGIFLKEPDQSQTYRLDLSSGMNEETDENLLCWNHYMYIVDCNTNTITGYTDFKNPKVLHIDEDIASYFDFSRLMVAPEQSSENILRMMDDLMIVEGAVDPQVLKKYYQVED